MLAPLFLLLGSTRFALPASATHVAGPVYSLDRVVHRSVVTGRTERRVAGHGEPGGLLVLLLAQLLLLTQLVHGRRQGQRPNIHARRLPGTRDRGNGSGGLAE